jgi:four helix bundle protein
MTGPQAVKDLKIWQKSIDLVEVCYRFSASLPADERFGLTAQIRRACTSIPANIAEGFGRWNAREFARFLAIASGSLRELETHLVISCRLGYARGASAQPIFQAIDDLARMLYRMRVEVVASVGRHSHTTQGHNSGLGG